MKRNRLKRWLGWPVAVVVLLLAGFMVYSSNSCTLEGVPSDITLEKLLRIRQGMQIDQLYELVGMPLETTSGEVLYQEVDGEFTTLNSGEKLLLYSKKPSWNGCYPEIVIRVSGNSVVMVFITRYSWWGIGEEPWYILARSGSVQEEKGFREAFASRRYTGSGQ